MITSFLGLQGWACDLLANQTGGKENKPFLPLQLGTIAAGGDNYLVEASLRGKKKQKVIAENRAKILEKWSLISGFQ